MNTTENFNGDQILITGGLGFIGSNLARRLVGLGANVTLVDSLIPEYGGNMANIAGLENKLNVNISDVRDPFAMRALVRDKDLMFNLAGQTSHLDSMQDPMTDLEINCRAQLSILECCRQHNKEIKIVFASTRQIYGKPDYLPVDEKHALRPVDVNGINKMAGEWYHILYNQVYGLRTCVLRLTNTYGPRMRVKDARQTFLGVWVRLLLEGRQIRVFGDGRQRRDLNYVDDAVEAMILAAVSETTDGQVFNLGGDEVVSLRALAELMIEINGGGSMELVPFPAELRKIDIGDYYSSHDKISQSLGWKPNVNLRDGLSRTIEYYRQHIQDYLR